MTIVSKNSSSPLSVLIINGSPRRNGATAKLLKAVAEGASKKRLVEFVRVYDLENETLLRLSAVPS